MRLLHTSDWHLGRSFHGAGLLGAQARYLDHLVEVVRAEGVDAVLVSGDVYDRALPSPDAVALLSESLTRLVDAGAQVVISSGNHDSATRLGFGSGLLQRSGLHIRSDVASIGTPVLVGDTAIYPLPYLDPVSAGVGEELAATGRTHTAVLEAAMRRVRADAAGRGPRTVVMSHCFAGGGTASDSERDIAVGGLAVVPASVFDGVGYAALGHLHRPQDLDERVRYPGSPLAMSFSEAGQAKGSLLVELDEQGRPEVRTVEAPAERPLAVLRGELHELLTSDRHTAAEDAYVQVTLTDPVRPVGAMDTLRRRFPHLLQLAFDPSAQPVPVQRYAQKVARRAPVDVCCDFVADVRAGAAATEEEQRLLLEALESGRRAALQADDAAPTGRARGQGAA